MIGYYSFAITEQQLITKTAGISVMLYHERLESLAVDEPSAYMAVRGGVGQAKG